MAPDPHPAPFQNHIPTREVKNAYSQEQINRFAHHTQGPIAVSTTPTH